jgi:hypothetical protein
VCEERYNSFFSVLEKHRKMVCGTNPVPIIGGVGNFSLSSFYPTKQQLKHISPVSIVYLIECTSKLGRFNPHLADSLGVPRSSVRKQLQAGEDVVLPNGQVIRASEVIFFFMNMFGWV